MLALGCFMAFAIVIAPRVMLLLAWLFSERWDAVWGSVWLWPLLGFLITPSTTVMYLLVWTPAGITGWDWMWIVLGILLDLVKWGQLFQNRHTIPGRANRAAATGAPVS